MFMNKILGILELPLMTFYHFDANPTFSQNNIRGDGDSFPSMGHGVF
jgi:hypothetical protein